ncbi:hypothetical protein [Actibacterium ureilyticum]|uniref:hypothetical protein n=1 Tax=Actibacterium ureilyticum TaxID=1590614 RepID=UPI000BAAE54B|nr:hypothetical protein [Actibacterium ureilyticum]
MRLMTLFLCLPVMASAQSLRPGDTRLSAAELSSHLSGQEVEFFDGSTARFGAGGDYAYRYVPDGPVWAGTYQTDDDSAVCITFDNGSARCDTFVRNGTRLYLITADGLRFPVRAQRPIEN